MIDRDLAQLISAAQHDALHPHAKLATILQPGTRLGWRLRTRDQPHLAGASWQDEDGVIAVADDRLDSALIGKQSQVSIHCRRALRRGLTQSRCAVSRLLPYRLHAGLVPYERSTRAGFARWVVSLVSQVRVQDQGCAGVRKEATVASVEIALGRQPLGQQDGVVFGSTW